MINRLTTLMLISTSIWAADFQNGQAARAVIGQASFTALDTGIAATTLVVSDGRLYVADATHRLLTYDLTKLPGPRDDLADRQGTGCAVCGFSPIAVANQPVLPGIAGVSVFGKTVVAADTANHRVLVWRDVSLPRSSQAPDIVLGRSSSDVSVSGSTLVEPVAVAFDGKRLFVADAALHRVLIWKSIPSSDNQPADAVLGQPNFTSSGPADSAGPETIARPVALASDGTNLFVADAQDRRILVFTPAEIALSTKAVLNSASLVPGPVAPGTLITISGSGLSDTSESAPDDGVQALPRNLAGVEVVFDGLTLPLLSVSPGEIRAQMPYDFGKASGGSLYVRTEREEGGVTTTNAVPVRMEAATPGLFAFGGNEPRIGLILHADRDQAGRAGSPVTAEDPAKPGEVLIFWAAGLGPVNNEDGVTALIAGVPYDGPDAAVMNPVDAVVSGRSAQVVSATLPRQAIGVYEIRIVLPPDLPSDPKTPLLIMQNGLLSNTVTIPVENAIH
ncbi:MAG: hypothetical protein WB992_15245 [Bryobacteraceae bacterium]